ncbi:MAG: hypothetical protein ACLU0O_00630 [Collinsella sp.]
MGLVSSASPCSTISILAVEAGADPNLGLVVFYLSSGFFVTFFTATLHSWHRACMRRPLGRHGTRRQQCTHSLHRASRLLS